MRELITGQGLPVAIGLYRALYDDCGNSGPYGHRMPFCMASGQCNRTLMSMLSALATIEL